MKRVWRWWTCEADRTWTRRQAHYEVGIDARLIGIRAQAISVFGVCMGSKKRPNVNDVNDVMNIMDRL